MTYKAIREKREGEEREGEESRKRKTGEVR